jgi:hypothetical protein
VGALSSKMATLREIAVTRCRRTSATRRTCDKPSLRALGRCEAMYNRMIDVLKAKTFADPKM